MIREHILDSAMMILSIIVGIVLTPTVTSLINKKEWSKLIYLIIIIYLILAIAIILINFFATFIHF